MDRTIKLTPAEAVDLLHQKDTRITELEAEVERLRESNQNRLNIFRKFLRKTKQVRLDLLAQEAAAGRLREWQRKAFAAHPNIDMDIEFVEGKDENPR